MISDCVTAPHPVLALQDWQAVFGSSEVIALAFPVKEEQIPEGQALAGQSQVLGVIRCSVENQVGEDALFLLPKILGSTPSELGRHAAARISLDTVKGTAPDFVEPDLAHAVG